MRMMVYRISWNVVLFILAHASLNAQEKVLPFDSLQDIIRTQIGQGTTEFLAVATMYDSLAMAGQDTLKMGKGRNFIGLHYYLSGNHRQAIQYYLQALPFFEAARDTFFVALVNNNIGAAYEYRQEPHNSILYYHKALGAFRLTSDTLWMANVYNNIGIQYNVALDHHKALEYLDTARVLYSTLRDTAMLVACIANIAECHRFIGNTDLAVEMGLSYINDYEKFHSTDVLGNVYSMLARSYLKKHDLTEAEKFNLLSLSIRNEYGLNYKKANNYETQSQIYEAKGDYRNALNEYKEFKMQQDSMFNKEKDDRITELLTEYEVEKKNQEITLLAARDEVNTLLIERSNRQKIVYGLGALTLLISALALVFLLRLKTKSNTQLEIKNVQISNALAEKDILLREIHHRVKNNLQMISALLYLHGKSVNDATAQEALLESQNRVQSMAMIHQNLYQDENLLGVGVQEYLEKLFGHLTSSYNIEKDRIAIHKHIEIDHLDVDTIVPMALIVNELISNALKYAFRDGRKGEINVYLGRKDGRIVLEVQDNGTGFPPGFDAKTSSGFGYKLIHILSDRLGASLDYAQDNGVQVRLYIPMRAAA